MMEFPDHLRLSSQALILSSQITDLSSQIVGLSSQIIGLSSQSIFFTKLCDWQVIYSGCADLSFSVPAFTLGVGTTRGQPHRIHLLCHINPAHCAD